MNLLLDTHVFLWFITGDDRLNKTQAQAEQMTLVSEDSAINLYHVQRAW